MPLNGSPQAWGLLVFESWLGIPPKHSSILQKPFLKALLAYRRLFFANLHQWILKPLVFKVSIASKEFGGPGVVALANRGLMSSWGWSCQHPLCIGGHLSWGQMRGIFMGQYCPCHNSFSGTMWQTLYVHS